MGYAEVPSVLKDFPRVLLWVVAIIAPGGFLLLPYLAVQTVRERRVRRQSKTPEPTAHAPLCSPHFAVEPLEAIPPSISG